jgi:methyl-accepting chemotaxis protein
MSVNYKKGGSIMKPRPNIGDVLSGTAKRRMKLGLNVRTKLLGGYVIVVVFVIVIFVIASNGLHAVGNSGRAGIEETKYLNQVLNMRTLVAEEWQLYTDYSLNHNAASLEKAREKGQEIIFQSEELRAYITAAYSVETADALDRFLTTHQQFVNNNEAAVVTSGGGSWVNGSNRAKIIASSELLYSAMADLESGIDNTVMAALADVDSTQDSAVVATAALAGLALLVAAGLGLFLSQRISSGVTSISKAMKLVATGDLTAEVKAASSDELGEMGITYKKMVNDLSGVIDNVRHSATRLASASRQLACAAEQAGGATKKAAVVSQGICIAAEEKSGSVGESRYPLRQLCRSRHEVTTDDRGRHEEVEEATSVIDYMSSATQQLTDRAQGVASGTVRTAATVKNGMDRLDKTINSLRKITFAMDDVAETMCLRCTSIQLSLLRFCRLLIKLRNRPAWLPGKLTVKKIMQEKTTEVLLSLPVRQNSSQS